MKVWTCIALFATLALAIPPPARADETAVAPPDATAATPEETADKVEPEKPALPLSLHCGQLVAIAPATTAEAVDMAKMIAQGKLEPQSDAMPETSLRSPAQGSVFAIAEVRLESRRSVGRTDFALRHGDATSKCLALASGQSAFDERVWEVGKGTVRLLFEVPAQTKSVALAYAQPLSIQLPPPPFVPFGAQPPPQIPADTAATTEDTPPPPKAEPPAKTAAKPTSAPKPDTKPKPKPAPAAKPKPKPKPKKPADAGIPLF